MKQRYAFRSDEGATQADGKVVVIGEFNHGIARLNKNGTVDHTFNPGGEGFKEVTGLNTIIVTPDQKIWVGGRFQSYNGVAVKNLIRLNADGTLDTTFDPSVYGKNPAWKDSAGVLVNPIDYDVRELELSPEGNRVWIRTYLYHYMNMALFPVRLDGSLDPSSGLTTQPRNPYNWLPGAEDIRNFTVSGNRIYSGFETLDLDGKLVSRVTPANLDGNILKIHRLSTGQYLVLSGAGDSSYGNLVRLNADGKIDSTFKAVYLEAVRQLEISELPNGRYLLNGSFKNKTLFEDSVVIDSNGGIVFDFTSRLPDNNYPPHAYYDSSTHKFFVIGGTPSGLCARSGHFNFDGSLDRTIYLSDPYYYGGGVLAELPNGNLLAEAKFHTDGIYAAPDSSEKRVDKLFELDSKTGAVVRPIGNDQAWFAQMNTSLSNENVMIEGNKALVWGGFSTYNGESNSGLIRIDLATGLRDPSFNGALNLSSGDPTLKISRLADGRYFVSGRFTLVGDASNKTYDYAYLREDGSIDPARPAVAFKDSSNKHETLDAVVYNHVVMPDGSIVFAGCFFLTVAEFEGPSEFGILYPDGHFDRTGFVYKRYERDFLPEFIRPFKNHFLALGATYNGAYGSLKLIDEKTGKEMPEFLIPLPFSGSHVNDAKITAFETLEGNQLLLGYNTYVKDGSATPPGTETLPGPFVIINDHGAVQRVITFDDLGIPSSAHREYSYTFVPKMLKMRDGSLIASFTYEFIPGSEHLGYKGMLWKLIKFNSNGTPNYEFRARSGTYW